MTRKTSSCSSKFPASEFIEECVRDQTPEPDFDNINERTNGAPQGNPEITWMDPTIFYWNREIRVIQV